MTISQPPNSGRSKTGGRSGSGSGNSSGRPPANGRNAQQRSGANRQTNQKPNASQKTAGNRSVNAKNLKGSNGRPTTNGAGGRGRGPAKPQQQIRGPRFSPTQIGIASIALVVVIVLVLVLVVVNKAPAKTSSSTPAVSATLLSTVTSVPLSVQEKIGLPSEIISYPEKIKGQKPLTSDGKPEFLFVGAEYCPFCAAERWGMVMALSKFGTFTGLKETESSSTDFAPDTATFTFNGSTYTSQYLVFKPYEVATNQQAASGASCNVNGYACLQTPPAEATSLWQNKNLGNGTFPFMDFGNLTMQAGAGFEDQPLVLAGLDYSEIASDLSDASSPVAQAEVGSANYFTAAICQMTHGQPGSVCSASYVASAQQKAQKTSVG